MRRIKITLRAIFILIVCIVFFVSSIYIFIAIKGESIIENSLENIFKKDVEISNFRISVPLNIKVSGIKIKDLGNIDYIYISPSLPGFLGAKIVLNNIIVNKPYIIFTRQKQELVIALAADSVDNKEVSAQEAKNFRFRINIPLVIKNLKIIDGKFEVIDKVISESGLKIKFDSLNFILKNYAYPPRHMRTIYQIKGNIPWENEHAAGRIDGQGWVNFGKRDMEGNINLRDIDGMYLSPYYNNYVNLADLKVEKASLDFLTDLNSSNNDLLIKSHLELKNMTFIKIEEPKDNSKEAPDAAKIMGAVFEVFSNIGGKIVLDFKIKTKFDRPRMGLENIKVSIEDKLSKKILN
ncbi:MAG: DUF748 domain-containing protein [Candidatus Omnitrophota bacterium]